MEQFIERIIASAIIIAVAFILYLIVQKIINRFLVKRAKKSNHKKSLTIVNVINNIIRTIFIILAILTIITVWGVDTAALIASLGIVGLVAGLAVQDTVKDVIAGASIIFDNEFDVGDNIQIGTFRGDVIDLGLQTTTIRAYTGEVKIISNRNITEVINYSRYPSLAVIDFEVPYETDLEFTENVINKVCERLNELPYLTKEVDFLGIQELKEEAIMYRITAECEPGMDFPCGREALKIIREEFVKGKINTPYKQVVVHNAK